MSCCLSSRPARCPQWVSHPASWNPPGIFDTASVHRDWLRSLVRSTWFIWSPGSPRRRPHHATSPLRPETFRKPRKTLKKKQINNRNKHMSFNDNDVFELCWCPLSLIALSSLQYFIEIQFISKLNSKAFGPLVCPAPNCSEHVSSSQIRRTSHQRWVDGSLKLYAWVSRVPRASSERLSCISRSPLLGASRKRAAGAPSACWNTKSYSSSPSKARAKDAEPKESPWIFLRRAKAIVLGSCPFKSCGHWSTYEYYQ